MSLLFGGRLFYNYDFCCRSVFQKQEDAAAVLCMLCNVCKRGYLHGIGASVRVIEIHRSICSLVVFRT